MGQEFEGDVSGPERDSSRPPAPLSQSGDAWAERKYREVKKDSSAAISTSTQALAIATEARDIGKRIEGMMGASPDPVRKIEGAGLLGGIAQVLDRLEAIEAADKAAAASRAWWAALVRGALVVLGAVATVVGIVKAVGGK